MPHAVLLTGPVGVGKRAAASWMAAQRLGMGNPGLLPGYPAPVPQHADLHWIAPLEDKKSIGIAQIRQLIAEFGLTSYEGGGKVAIIEPANAMTPDAANSLLKTLEEPSGDALLILIADRAGRLPATIYSRCQRIQIAPPDTAHGLAWLDRLQPGTMWAEALRLAGNAPLAAVAGLDELATHESMAEDFAAIAQGKTAALEVAERWARLDPEFVLNWLTRQVQQAIFSASSDRRTGPQSGIDQTVLNRVDRRNLFCYLDTINRLRGQPAGSYNVQLTLDSLLIDWADGLVNCNQSPWPTARTQLAER